MIANNVNFARVAAMLLVSVCVLPISGQAETPIVIDIKAFVFAPQEITVARGATVTWVNHDQEVHSVISKEGRFVSSGLDTDDRFTFTFDTKGDFAYLCGLHPHMTGVIHVRD
jgi:plastocyanin